MKRPSISVRRQPFPGPVVWLGVVVLIAGVVGYLMYDLGLSKAGFRSSAAAAEIEQLEAQNEQLARTNKSLSEQVAVLETAAKIDREAYRQVDAQLAELQSKILAQQEDLEFYRGIVGEDDGSELRIQSFQVLPGMGEREYELRLVLAQALRADREISGQVELQLEGLQRSEPHILDMDALNPQQQALSYRFRYFQDLKADIVLPAAFEPRRVRVLVRPRSRSGKSAKTVEEFFAWQPENG